MEIEADHTSTQQAPTLTTDLIFRNFAIATALFTLSVAACASAFMFGYFSAFNADYQSTRFVQYTDVLQFAFNISGQIFLIICGFVLITVELSKRLRHPLARVDAQAVATMIITPMAIWSFWWANGYRATTAGFFVALTIIIATISLNMAWPTHALRLYRLIPSLYLLFLGLAGLGNYFGGTADEERHFEVVIGEEKQPRALFLVMLISRGYMFFDPSNQQMILVPEKEIKLIAHATKPPISKSDVQK